MPNIQPNQVAVQLLLDRETRDRLKLLANGRGQSIASFIRHAMQEKLDREGIQIDVNHGVQEWGANKPPAE